MNLLAHYGPQNLNEAWMYFKHWVKRRPVNTVCLHEPGSIDPDNSRMNGTGPSNWLTVPFERANTNVKEYGTENQPFGSSSTTSTEERRPNTHIRFPDNSPKTPGTSYQANAPPSSAFQAYVPLTPFGGPVERAHVKNSQPSVAQDLRQQIAEADAEAAAAIAKMKEIGEAGRLSFVQSSVLTPDGRPKNFSELSPEVQQRLLADADAEAEADWFAEADAEADAAIAEGKLAAKKAKKAAKKKSSEKKTVTF